MSTSREDVTKRIRQQKVLLKKNWRDLAKELNVSAEWTVAACLGQMQMTPQQSQVVGKYFGLTPEECLWLTQIPYRNSLNGGLPSDPVLYRLHEVSQSLNKVKESSPNNHHQKMFVCFLQH